MLKFFIIKDIKLLRDLVKKNLNSSLVNKTIFVKNEKDEIKFLQKIKLQIYLLMIQILIYNYKKNIKRLLKVN